jgi:predicted NodU family carbamoyl transferase
MTLIARLNVAQPESGLPLLDGECVVVRDGHVTGGISEERLNRQKYSPGFAASL